MSHLINLYWPFNMPSIELGQPRGKTDWPSTCRQAGTSVAGDVTRPLGVTLARITRAPKGTPWAHFKCLYECFRSSLKIGMLPDSWNRIRITSVPMDSATTAAIKFRPIECA